MQNSAHSIGDSIGGMSLLLFPVAWLSSSESLA